MTRQRAHPEDDLQMAVAQYLRIQYPQLLWWHTPNSIVASGDRIKRMRTIMRFKKMGMLPGVGDIIMIWPGGKAAIELKVGKNDLEGSQKVFKFNWLHSGGQYALCRSVDEVIKVMHDWKVPTQVCPTRYAEGAVTIQKVKPSVKGKRGDA